jgi:hypothetical protein
LLTGLFFGGYRVKKLALILLLAGSSAVMAAEGRQAVIDAFVLPVDPMAAGLDTDALWATVRGTSVYAAGNGHDKPEGCKEGPGLGLGLCKDAPSPAPTPEPGTLALIGAGLLAGGWIKRTAMNGFPDGK